MQKESYLSELNRRREANRRIRLMKERMYAMPVELSYAQGKMAKLPRGMVIPPAWALRSACRAWDVGFRSVRKVMPEEGKPLDEGAIFELIGLFESMVCFMNHPAGSVAEVESDVPEMAGVRKPFAKGLAKRFRVLMKILKRGTGRDVAVPPLKDLVEREARYRAGLTGFITPEGDLPGLRTLTAQIYHVVWLLWPEIKKDFTAPWLHGFLATECGISASDKLVEKIVTDIRRPAAEGRKTEGNPK